MKFEDKEEESTGRTAVGCSGPERFGMQVWIGFSMDGKKGAR